jgi:4-oxalocrotonate tautomerase
VVNQSSMVCVFVHALAINGEARLMNCKVNDSYKGIGNIPHVVKLWPGKAEHLKQQLAEKIAKDVMDVLNYGDESISVGFEEISSKDWKQEVYKPDIQGKWDRLYKKPGYEM